MLDTTLWKRLARKMTFNLLLLGLSATGKKLFLNQLKGSSASVRYNQGALVDTIQYDNLSIIACMDTGKGGIGSEWRKHCSNIDAVIFIVDSNDQDRIDMAADQLNEVLAEEALKSSVLLVVANKQDLNGSLSPNAVTDRLVVMNLRGRDWLVQGTSCATGQGISEGMNWLAQTLSKKSPKT